MTTDPNTLPHEWTSLARRTTGHAVRCVHCGTIGSVIDEDIPAPCPARMGAEIQRLRDRLAEVEDRPTETRDGIALPSATWAILDQIKARVESAYLDRIAEVERERDEAAADRDALICATVGVEQDKPGATVETWRNLLRRTVAALAHRKVAERERDGAKRERDEANRRAAKMHRRAQAVEARTPSRFIVSVLDMAGRPSFTHYAEAGETVRWDVPAIGPGVIEVSSTGRPPPRTEEAEARANLSALRRVLRLCADRDAAVDDCVAADRALTGEDRALLEGYSAAWKRVMTEWREGEPPDSGAVLVNQGEQHRVMWRNDSGGWDESDGDWRRWRDHWRWLPIPPLDGEE